MDEQKFWDLIQSAHIQSNGDMDGKSQVIKESISKLSTEDATVFLDIFDSMMDKAYSWPLWGAAYVINGGCSDDSFTDFRSSLISRGKDKFIQAVTNPDSLADEKYDEDLWFFEGFQYAITEGVEENIGSSLDKTTSHPEEPSGEPWGEEPEELKTKYPRLWIKFEYIWSPLQPFTEQEKKPWWKFW